MRHFGYTFDNTEIYRSTIKANTDNINNYLNSVLEFLDTIQTYIEEFEKISEYTNSATDYIIKTYEKDPENASLELTNLYNEAIKIKNNEELNNMKNSLDNDKQKIDDLKNNINKTMEKINEVSAKLQDEEVIDYVDNIRKMCINIKDTEIKVKEFIRFAVGEGLEKKQENFADEVNKAMKG